MATKDDELLSEVRNQPTVSIKLKTLGELSDYLVQGLAEGRLKRDSTWHGWDDGSLIMDDFIIESGEYDLNFSLLNSIMDKI